MATASHSLATALWRARFASGLLRPSYTTSLDTTQIVGRSGNDAMLWSPTGSPTDLAAILGQNWSHTEATEIDASGDIVGHGYYERKFASFLLMNSGSAPDHYTTVEPYTPSIHPTLAPALT